MESRTVLELAERVCAARGLAFLSAGVSRLTCTGFRLVVEADVMPIGGGAPLARVERTYEGATLALCAAALLSELRP